MDTQPEKEISETPEATPTESAEKLSPQGIAAMQGGDTNSQVDLPSETNPDISPPPDAPTPPPSDHQPVSAPLKESQPEPKIEVRAKPEKEQSSPIDTERPGSLKYQPSGRGSEFGG
jgi:hypothetical protein